MKEPTRSLLISQTVMTLLIGVGVWTILKTYLPYMLVKGFITIPIFFYLTGFIFIFCIKRYSHNDVKYIVNLYLLMKMVKMFISSVIIFIYWIVHNQSLRNFILIFMIFYLLSMTWETIIYLRMEKYIKYKHIT